VMRSRAASISVMKMTVWAVNKLATMSMRCKGQGRGRIPREEKGSRLAEIQRSSASGSVRGKVLEG